MWAELLNRVTKRSLVLNGVEKMKCATELPKASVAGTPPPKVVVSFPFRFGFFYKVRRNCFTIYDWKESTWNVLGISRFYTINRSIGWILQKNLGAVRSCRRHVIPKRYGYSPDRNFDSLYFISYNCCRTNTIMPVPIHSSAAFLRQHLRRSWTSNFIKQKVVLKRNS